MGNYLSCTVSPNITKHAGNYLSCTLSRNMGKQCNRGAKVILPCGEIRRFDTPVKAAELMFETPNFFLVNSQSLHIGRRFSALNADEDLEMGNVYVMFPMKRVSSIVTAADLGAFFVTANSGGMLRISPEAAGDAKVTPVSVSAGSGSNSRELPRLNLDDIEDFSLPEMKHRLSVSRSKKPLLETITEEPVHSR